MISFFAILGFLSCCRATAQLLGYATIEDPNGLHASREGAKFAIPLDKVTALEPINLFLWGVYLVRATADRLSGDKPLQLPSLAAILDIGTKFTKKLTFTEGGVVDEPLELDEDTVVVPLS